LAVISVDDDRVTAVIGVEIAENVALRVQQESVDASLGGKVTDVVRDHSIEPADTVSTRQRDFGAIAQVVDAAAVPESR